MQNQPHPVLDWYLKRDYECNTECFKFRDVDCYHDLTTGSYYAFLGVTRIKKIEADTREELEYIIVKFYESVNRL